MGGGRSRVSFYFHRSGYQSSRRLSDLPKFTNMLTGLPGSKNNSNLIACVLSSTLLWITSGATLCSIIAPHYTQKRFLNK